MCNVCCTCLSTPDGDEAYAPTRTSTSSVLINCHYDTVINSTGASDDAVSCAMMLEVLRVLAVSPRPLRHSVVFLFNGAEENILQVGGRRCDR